MDIELIFFLAFFGIIAFIVVGSIIYSALRKKKFKKYGKKQFARFVDMVKGATVTHTVNDRVVDVTQYYCVKFQFRGSDGKIINGKTSHNVELVDAEKLQRAYYFQVYVLNDKAILLNFPTEQEIAKFSKYKDYKYCSYCGSQSKISDNKCPNCGASEFKDIL